MQSNISTNTQIAALTVEIDAIHFANGLYWKQENFQTVAAREEYQRRQDRLEEIRIELAQLRWETAANKEKGKYSGSDGKKKKRPYVPPTITNLPFEKAKHIIVDRTHRSDQEAVDLPESLHREQRRKESIQPSADDRKWKRSA
jgi:hypothetical protein